MLHQTTQPGRSHVQPSTPAAAKDIKQAATRRDNFITKASHELRTPLTVIKGYSELLQMTAADQLDEEQMQFIGAIHESVTDLLAAIQQTLDLFQIEAGTLGIDREIVDLAKLTRVEARRWRTKMASRQLTFTSRVSSEAVWVEGDWNRLTWVVHNLLSNACTYTPAGGQVQLVLSQTQGVARVAVQDNGPGIGPAKKHLLFTPFFPGNPPENPADAPRFGLGLTISKAIIEAHEEGKIWAETELKQGSTFSFSLPCLQ